jgi:hypothetical protein
MGVRVNGGENPTKIIQTMNGKRKTNRKEMKKKTNNKNNNMNIMLDYMKNIKH